MNSSSFNFYGTTRVLKNELLTLRSPGEFENLIKSLIVRELVSSKEFTPTPFFVLEIKTTRGWSN